MTQPNPPPRSVTAALRARPAAAFAICLVPGIALRDLLPCRPWLWMICLFAFLVLSAILHRRTRFADLALALAIALVGLLAAQIAYFQYPANHVWIFTSQADRFAQLDMKIDDPPRLIPPAPDDPRLLGPKQTVRANVVAIQTRQGRRPAVGAVSLFLEEFNPRLAPGQIVRATGILERPSGAMNPGEFDFAAWERSIRTLASLRVSHAGGAQILSDPGPGPIEWLREKSRHLLARGFLLGQSYDHALLQAFVLGDSDPQLNDLEDQLVSTGTVHCMSISGLHIAIAGGFVLFLGRLFRASPKSSLIAAMTAVILYALVATPTWPGWRSVIMFCAFGIAMLARRRPDSIQLFCVAIAAILLIHPDDLTNGGFQISFAAVLGMILFAQPTFYWFWATWRGPDAVALRPPPRNAAANAGRWIVRFFVSAIGAMCIAWLMVIPLIAYHYGQLNTYSALAGVILLPVTVVSLLFGLAKIALTLCWPGPSHLWAVVCSFPVTCLRQIVELIARIPGSKIPLPTPPLWMLFVYYALFAVTLLHFRSSRARQITRLGPAIAVAAFFLSPLLGLSRAGPSGSQYVLTLLSIGDGQCAVLRTPDRHIILIDAGSQTVSNLRRGVLEPYLQTLDCADVDQMILSDDSYAHLSAAGEIFRDCGHPTVFISPVFARHAMGNIPAEDLLDTLFEAQTSPRILKKGDHLQLPGGATLDVLWPPPDCNLSANNCGLVMKFTCAGRTFLFTADIQDPALRELLKHPALLKCDVLIAPHQGSAEAATAAFLRAAHPQLIIASGNAKLSRRQRLFDDLASGRPFYRTSRSGAVTITVDPAGNLFTATFLGTP